MRTSVPDSAHYRQESVEDVSVLTLNPIRINDIETLPEMDMLKLN